MSEESGVLGSGRNNKKVWIGIGIGLFLAILIISLFFNLRGCLETRPPVPSPGVITVTSEPAKVPTETQVLPSSTPVVIVVSATPGLPTVTPVSSETPLPLPTNTSVPPTSTPTNVPPRHYGEIEHYWPPKELTVPALADGKVYEKANNQTQVLWEIGRFPQDTHPYANALVWGFFDGNWATYFELLNRDEQGRWVVQGYLLSNYAFTPTPVPTAVVPSATPTSTSTPVATLISWDVTYFAYESLPRKTGEDFQKYAAKAQYNNIPGSWVTFTGPTTKDVLLCDRANFQVSFSYEGSVYQNRTIIKDIVLEPYCPKYHYVLDDFAGRPKPQLVVSVDQANLRTAGFVTPETRYGDKTVGRGTVFNPNDVIALVISENYHGNPYWWLVRNIFAYPWEEPKEILLHSSLVYPPIPLLTPGPSLTLVVSPTPLSTTTPTVTGTPAPQAKFEIVESEVIVKPDNEERIVIQNTGNTWGDFTGHQLIIARPGNGTPKFHYYTFPNGVGEIPLRLRAGQKIVLYIQKQGENIHRPDWGFELYWNPGLAEKVWLDDNKGLIWLYKLQIGWPPQWDYLVDFYVYGNFSYSP